MTTITSHTYDTPKPSSDSVTFKKGTFYDWIRQEHAVERDEMENFLFGIFGHLSRYWEWGGSVALIESDLDLTIQWPEMKCIWDCSAPDYDHWCPMQICDYRPYNFERLYKYKCYYIKLLETTATTAGDDYGETSEVNIYDPESFGSLCEFFKKFEMTHESCFWSNPWNVSRWGDKALPGIPPPRPPCPPSPPRPSCPPRPPPYLAHVYLDTGKYLELELPQDSKNLLVFLLRMNKDDKLSTRIGDPVDKEEQMILQEALTKLHS